LNLAILCLIGFPIGSLNSLLVAPLQLLVYVNCNGSTTFPKITQNLPITNAWILKHMKWFAKLTLLINQKFVPFPRSCWKHSSHVQGLIGWMFGQS
jgi:hypothetical protein